MLCEALREIESLSCTQARCAKSVANHRAGYAAPLHVVLIMPSGLERAVAFASLRAISSKWQRPQRFRALIASNLRHLCRELRASDFSSVFCIRGGTRPAVLIGQFEPLYAYRGFLSVFISFVLLRFMACVLAVKRAWIWPTFPCFTHDEISSETSRSFSWCPVAFLAWNATSTIGNFPRRKTARSRN